ncbi:MAG: alpha/beta hydrolase [Bacteroidetes bacterium]|nr:alpha/beta hydrolase [Bacteroidota bacterium]
MPLKYFYTHFLKWRKPIGWLLLLYLLAGWIFYANQDAFIFRARVIHADKNVAIQAPHKEITIPINQEDTLHLISFITDKAPARGVVLYFHGNRENVEWYAPKADLFTQEGYEVLMMDYPGYGKSRGEISEQKIYQWAIWAYQLARKQFSSNEIIIYGKSLGTGVAAYLASVKDCRQLILETPYTNFPAVFSYYAPIYPFKTLLQFQFPTEQFLEQVVAPIRILHGTNDFVVAHQHSLQLAKHKKGISLLIIKGGAHNNLFDFQLTRTTLKKWLSH